MARRRKAVGDEPVGEALDVAALNVAEPHRAEVVRGHRGRAPRGSSGRSRACTRRRSGYGSRRSHPVDELVGRLVHGHRRRRSERSAADAVVGVGAPRPRGGERRKGLSDLPAARPVEDRRLVAAAAVAAAAAEPRAGQSASGRANARLYASLRIGLLVGRYLGRGRCQRRSALCQAER